MYSYAQMCIYAFLLRLSPTSVLKQQWLHAPCLYILIHINVYTYICMYIFIMYVCKYIYFFCGFRRRACWCIERLHAPCQCIYIHIYEYVQIYVYIGMGIYTHFFNGFVDKRAVDSSDGTRLVYVYKYVYMYVRINAYTYVYVYTYMYTIICIQFFSSFRRRMHVYMYICIYIPISIL